MLPSSTCWPFASASSVLERHDVPIEIAGGVSQVLDVDQVAVAVDVTVQLQDRGRAVR